MARTIAKDHDEKRAAILATAARFFAEEGYDRASMSQLAAECGVSKALIYHYYGSKEALLFDILNNHLSMLLGVVKTIEMKQDEPEQNLRGLVSALLESYRGADFQHRLQLESMGALTTDQQKFLSDIQRQIVKIFAHVIADIYPQFFARNKSRLFPVTMSLFAMLNWFYQWHRPDAGITREAYAHLATDLLLGGLERLASMNSVD